MLSAKHPNLKYFVGVMFIVIVGFLIDHPKLTKLLLEHLAGLSTLVIAIFTVYLALETSRLRKLQATQIDELRTNSFKPNIDIYVFYQNSGNAFHFRITNNGSGTAFDVKFKFINETKNQNTGSFDQVNNLFNRYSMIKNGLSSIGPGRDRASILMSQAALIGYSTYKAKVEITYNDSEGNLNSSKSYIDFSELVL